MKNLIWYSHKIIKPDNYKYPGLEKFCELFKVFKFDYPTVLDRSEVIKMPIRLHNLFPVPKFQVMQKSFEQVCNERAQELLTQMDTQKNKMYVLYSGGIDSTLILVSLLKFATAEQKKKITVLMTEESIRENPVFYKNHILGNLNVASSLDFRELIGQDLMMVSGESNDTVFCGNTLLTFTRFYSVPMVHEPYNREAFVNFFDQSTEDRKLSEFLTDLIEKCCKQAPIKLVSNLDYLWWYGFTFRWQTAHLKPLAMMTEKFAKNMNKELFYKHHISFYHNDDFQLWSMNNLDKRIRDTWKSYKWVCKEIIFAFDKNQDYFENKTKIVSFDKVVGGNKVYNFIDENFNFYYDLPTEEYYNPDNDFI